MTTLQQPATGATTLTSDELEAGATLMRAFNLRQNDETHAALVRAYVAGDWSFPERPLTLLPVNMDIGKKQMLLADWLRSVPLQWQDILTRTLRSKVTYLNMVAGKLYAERD